MRLVWGIILMVALCGAVFVTIAPIGEPRWWWAVFAVMAIVEGSSQIGTTQAMKVAKSVTAPTEQPKGPPIAPPSPPAPDAFEGIP